MIHIFRQDPFTIGQSPRLLALFFLVALALACSKDPASSAKTPPPEQPPGDYPEIPQPTSPLDLDQPIPQPVLPIQAVGGILAPVEWGEASVFVCVDGHFDFQ